MHISILAFDGCPASSVSGPLEILSLAKRLLPKDYSLTIELLSAGANPLEIQCEHQIALKPHRSIADVSQTDFIVVGAIGYPTQLALNFPQPAIEWIKQQHKHGTTIASICTGAFVLAASGLLAGKPATTHWRCTSCLQRLFADVKVQPSALITDSDRLICAGGASAYQDLCLYLVKKLWGPALAQACAKTMLIDLDRDSQSKYAQFDANRQHSDTLIHKVQDWIDLHYQSSLLITGLAAKFNLSERQLKRRCTPATKTSLLSYIQQLRIEWAKKRLESSNETIEAIARASGYEDMRFFRDLFKRHTELTPSEYRNKFQMRF